MNLYFKMNTLISNTVTLETLPALPEDRISFIQYSKDNCINCEAGTPHFNELKERLKDEAYHLRMRTIDCSKYNCINEGIRALPTYVLYEGKKEIGRLPGMRPYEVLADFLIANTNIDKDAFIKVKHNEGVITLYERDFYNIFEAPWIILFYENRKDPFREMFLKLTEKFIGSINVAEINKKNAKNVALKYNIQHFPSVIAFNEGIQAYYLHGYDQEKLESFTKTLLSKSFQSINFEEFDKLDSELSKTKEPIFLLLYKDLSLANKLLKEKAHSYKMKTKIFRTNDERLFERIGFFPDEKTVVFTVYKNGSFFKFNDDLEKEEALSEWIFHSHFPHLTSVDNDNFVQIFHGHKTVVLLLTKNEEFNEDFEDVVYKLSHGLPFLNVLFATLNTEKFPDFINNLLPKIDIPSIVLYDTKRKIFYYRKINLGKNLLESIINLVKEFNDGKLAPYLNASSGLKIYVFLLIVFVFGVIFYNKFFANRGSKKDDK